MEFWADFFGYGKKSEGQQLVEQFRPLMLDAVNNNFPLRDPKGNPVANIAQVNISGTTHSHLNSSPLSAITHLHAAETLVLVPNPENEHDPEAVRVMTLKGQQIGWIPRSYAEKSLIFRRLQEGYHVCCIVKDFGVSDNGYPWCEVRVTTYETPFDTSLEKKFPNSFIVSNLKLREMLESETAK